MPRYTAAVVIPIYKPDLTRMETISLKQCITVLKDHPIIFFGPPGLNTGSYEDICHGQVPFSFQNFDKSFFGNIEGYNRLMLSAGFYKVFRRYRYILVYQLDAYVFKNDLAYWCSQGYDYIGAPALPHNNGPGEMQFLKGYSKFITAINFFFKTNHRINHVGNGGFSLRNTRKCQWLLQLLEFKVKIWGTNNEDGFFKYWGNLAFPFFKLPDEQTALRFSIELSPAAALEQLRGELPFGCHAFETYEPETWKPYINDF